MTEPALAAPDTPHAVRIESNGYGGNTDGNLNTRVTVGDVDVSRYVTDIAWAVGISGWGFRGGDPRATAEIRCNTVMLDAVVPVGPERAEAIQRIREDRRPTMADVRQLLDELDQTRARAAALQDQAAALAGERDEARAYLVRIREAGREWGTGADASCVNYRDTEDGVRGFAAERGTPVFTRQLYVGPWREAEEDGERA